jgi:hypothetical protein
MDALKGFEEEGGEEEGMPVRRHGQRCVCVYVRARVCFCVCMSVHLCACVI